ncbi:MAG: glycoside hydrolase domain-containing protein [Pirellulales bacterium]
MMNTRAVREFVTSLLVLLSSPAWCPAAQGLARSKDVAPAVVLDTLSVWRIHETLKPPVIQIGDGLKPVTSTYEWLDRETDAAPAGWTNPEFSDATWLRGSARATSRTPYVAQVCLRARFEVTDPAQVKDLKLTVVYYGGAIVRLNGRELARGNLAKEGEPELADGYPPEAFVAEDGKMLPSASWQMEKFPKALAARARTLQDVTIPANLLRKGVNVLAIEVVRAPYNKILDEKKNQAADKRELANRNCPYELSWNTCEVRWVQLAAGSAAGIVPNASRPADLQVWNSDLLTSDYSSDFGDRCEAIRPVELKGPGNGYISGKVVIGASKAIEGLKVACGDLKQGTAVIPAAQMRARYAVPFGRTASNGDDHGNDAAELDCLLEAPLDSFPATTAGKGAVVPIWLTLQAPKEAKPGVYAGQVTIEVQGEKALTVPVRAEISEYSVPDTQDYRTWIELMQSPDTLAVEYKVPPWSDGHWAMIADSMRYLGEIGSRVVHVPLIAQTNSGNEQSMVRFIKKADGTYDYDFSIMDKYLDQAEKCMGRPKITAFTAWEIYLDTPKEEVKFSGKEEQSNHEFDREGAWREARWDLRGKGPAVTALDPATGQLTTVNLPRFDDPKSKAIWKPLFDALRKRMAKRGLERTMVLGMASDRWPSKEELTVLQDASGNLPWINHTHGGSHVGSKLDGVASVAYTAYVWNVQYANAPPINADPVRNLDPSHMYGWKRPELYAEFRRFTALNDWPPSTILLFSELQITGQQRGLGRVGADFWPVYKDKRGRRRDWIWDRYPQSLWHSCNLMSHMLVPGPTGPVASTRYELLREGIQQCEARIAIESVLTDAARKAKLPQDLAERSQRLLDDRVWQELKAFGDMQLTGRSYATARDTWNYGAGGTAGHYWYASSGWRDRAQKLYDLAGEVTRRIAPGPAAPTRGQ